MDSDSLALRLKRYAQVTSAVSGLAARFLGDRYLGITIDRPIHASDLREILGQLKGPVMKIAQFLATVPGALPPEYAQEMALLQTNAPPMNPSFVLRRMRGELGEDWREKFASFEEKPFAAASLGQVHRAVTLTGQAVACKLQYPNMVSIIEADLQQLKLILGVYAKISRALQTDDVEQEIVALLHEELDYLNEAHNCELYQKIFYSHNHIRPPGVEKSLTSKRLLTMEFLPGSSLLELPEGLRYQAGILLFESWYKPLYHYAIIHGDPHPGNYSYCPVNQRLNLMDFGCVRIFDPRFIQGVIELYRALLSKDKERAVYAYTIWGFQQLNNEVIDIITQWAELLYSPLLDDCVRLIQDPSQTNGWRVATAVHQALHRAGGVRPPREFVFMDRAAVGIGSVLMRLQVRANWHRLFEELITDFSLEKTAHHQQKILHSLPSQSNIN